MAEHGFGGGNAIETDRALGELHVHGRISFAAAAKVGPLDRLINLDYVNQYEKIRRPLPVGPRGLGRTRDLAGHALRLCQPRPDPLGAVGRIRAATATGPRTSAALKERRAPSPEPRGMRSFDADLPVMDSSIATITEDGPIYRGVNCVDLAETRHARTRRDAAVGRHRRRSVCAGQLPARLGRNARGRRGRAQRRADRSRHCGAGAGGQRRSARLYPRARRTRHGRRPHPAAGGRDHAEPRSLGRSRCICRSPRPGRPTTSTPPI